MDTGFVVDLIPPWATGILTAQTTNVYGCPVSYLTGGTGPPLVMLHGLGGSLDWWQKNVAGLAKHFELYLLDLPGFGRMGKRSVKMSMPDYAEWIIAFLDSVELDRSHLIGHSMGGHLAIRLAAGHPERVDRLVLVSPAGVLPDAELTHYVLPVIKLLREIPLQMLPLALLNLRQADIRTLWHNAHDLIEHDVLTLLPQVKSPSLLIWGSDDSIIPVSLAETFLEKLPDSRLSVFEGAGHIPMLEHAERFDREVIEFLRESRIETHHTR